MSIEKRKVNGQIAYRVRIHEKSVIIDEATFHNRVDAEEWERKKKQQQTELRFFPERPRMVQYQEVFEEWFRIHCLRNKSPNSQVKDRQVYRDYINPFFGKYLLKDLRPQLFDLYIDRLQKETELSNNSINKTLEVLRATLNFAVSRQYIPHNPMAAVKMLKVIKKPFSYWTKDEASAFLSYTNEKYVGEERWKYVLYFYFSQQDYVFVRPQVFVGRTYTLMPTSS